MRPVLVLLLLAPLALAAAAGGPSDEFEGGLSAPWTIVRESKLGWSTGTCVPGDPAGCYLTISPARGDLLGATNDAKNVFLQPAPDGDFRVTMQLAFFPTRAGQHAGLLLHAGDDDLFYFGVGNDDERVLEAVLETGGVAETSTFPTEWSPVFLRYERVGEDVTAYASPDGWLWTAAGTGRAPSGAALRTGIFAAKGTGAGSSDATEVLNADFGYFRVEAPPQGVTHVEPPAFALDVEPGSGEAPFTAALAATASWDYPGLAWTLSFGDGAAPATGVGLPLSVQHSWQEAGTYTARLTARNAFGVLGTSDITVEVGPPAPEEPEETPPAASPEDDAAEPAADDVAAGAVAAPSGGIVVLDPEGRILARAQGTVRLRATGVPGAGDATFVVVGEDGARAALDGSGEATWDTTASDNGRYTVEARDGDVLVAAREVVVENPRATLGDAAGAVVAGAAVVATMSLGVGALAGRLDLVGYLADATQNLGEDVARKKTADVAALDRKRAMRSLVLAGVALALNALMFAYAEVEPWDAALFVASLPFFGGAALLYASTRYVSETEAAHATGATVRFRIWVPGTVSLLVSALVFRSPFGYPGFLRKNEPVTADPKEKARASGLRALASLGIYLAVTVPFVAVGLWWRYDFAEIGVTIALAAFGSAVLPFDPLPGGAVWKWSKPVSVAAVVAGLALYFLFQLALLSLDAVLVVGLVGAAGAVAAALKVRGFTRFATETEVNEDG